MVWLLSFLATRLNDYTQYYELRALEYVKHSIKSTADDNENILEYYFLDLRGNVWLVWLKRPRSGKRHAGAPLTRVPAKDWDFQALKFSNTKQQVSKHQEFFYRI